jgi:hypothetical protein
MFYRVAYKHQSFVRMLLSLDIPLAAVREQNGDRLYLAMVCKSTAQADRRTVEIVEALAEQPELLADLDLGRWRARRIRPSRLLLYWPGIEVESVHLH